MFIYKPYFYVIQNTITGLYYAGSKYSKNANPSDFMTYGGYTTSSKIIKSIIEKSGLESFVIRKIKVFALAKEAYEYETRFLRKVNAKQNPKFYNGHNNDFSRTYDPNWRKIPDINGVTSYKKGSKKSTETMMSTIIDGKNIYQISYEKATKKNPNLNKIRSEKSRQSKLLVDEETGLNVYQKIGQKISGEKNPSKKPENASKISEGKKKAISNNKEKWLEQQRKLNHNLSFQKDENGLTARNRHSLWMKENNPTKGSMWINNGMTNLRIKRDENIPEGYIPGRVKN